MSAFSFPRYLSAKRTVDDRALNRSVWKSFRQALGELAQPARILEIGGGTGAMFQRLVGWGALRDGHYTLLDESDENIAAAHQSLPDWGQEQGWLASKRGEQLQFTNAGSCLDLDLVTGDLFDFILRSQQAPAWDVVVAHAFLDLVDIPRTLPLLRSLARPGSLFYLTINFDGLTAFEPVIDARLDEQIVRLYHQTMDDRLSNGLPSGDSRSGRHLFSWLPQSGFEILSAGSSDWTVYPCAGQYQDDEAYFLNCILHFFEESLSQHPELSPQHLAGWLARRREQLARGELVYLAHQFDFLAVQR
jgi:SAM-dependent methyltransferase